MNKKLKNFLKILIISVAFFGIVSVGTAASANGSTAATAAVRSLKIGMSGNDVIELQNFLETKGFLKMPQGIAKGYFGRSTENALKLYQKSVGINAIGVYGPATRARVVASTVGASIEVSGWVPYWRKATGTADAISHIDSFKEINPFGYTVKQDGTLFDAMKVSEDPWPTLIQIAKEKKVRVIPTVMWSNGEAIHETLKDPKLRKAHIQSIVSAVNENNFDGIDIDYEGKKAETRPYYSLFLKELYKAIGKKWVVCTIEARTPLESRYDTIPPGIEYANDYKEINKYCDRVRIMAYDQGSIDVKLNRTANGTPYVPVADTRWVEKVISLAIKDISKKKIVIGIPTYGYEYEVTPLSEYGYRYDLLWAFNQKYALDLAKQLNITPSRNLAGEKSFTYVPVDDTLANTTANTSVENATETANVNNPEVATTTYQTASAATAPLVPKKTRIVWWSDAEAIKAKVDLARKLGVRGVAIFKIDGGEDPAMWEILK